MAKQRNDFALGLWVLAVIVLFVGGLIFIGGQNLGRAYQAYTVRYPVTYALPDEIKAGAAVHCGATRVGKVTGVSLRRGEADDDRLWAYLNIEVDQIVELRSGCRILARGPLLGGGGKLIITDPGSEGAVIQAGGLVDGAQAGTFEAALDMLNSELDPANPLGLLAVIKTQLDPNDVRGIIGKVHRSLDDLNAITHFMELQLDPAERQAMMSKLHAILDNVNATTGQLRAEVGEGGEGVLLTKVHAAMDAVNAGLTDLAGMVAENRPVVRQTLANVENTADSVRTGIVDPIAQELNPENVQGMLSQVHEAFGRINSTLADVGVVADRTKSLIVLNENRIQRLLSNVSETSLHLKHASKDLRRNPWRLFYRPTDEQTQELNIFDAAREFSAAAERLDDSAVMLDALMKAYDGQVPAQAPELAEVREKLKATFQDYLRAEEALWKKLDLR